jgi:hypothetical protein
MGGLLSRERVHGDVLNERERISHTLVQICRSGGVLRGGDRAIHSQGVPGDVSLCEKMKASVVPCPVRIVLFDSHLD